MQTQPPFHPARILRPFLLACLALPTLPVAATTYTLVTPNYTSSYLGSAPSSPYTTAMHVTGSFTTAAPLPPNMSATAIAANGSNLVTAWSFNDGVINFTNANSALYGNYPTSFEISTDASGQIATYSIQLVSPAPPHSMDQTVATLVLNGSMTLTVGDAKCTLVNADNLCNNVNQAVATQSARYNGAGTWTMAADPPAASVAAVPALGPAGLGLLAAMLGGLAVRLGRRRH